MAARSTLCNQDSVHDMFLCELKWGCWEAGSGLGKTVGMVIIRQETGNGVVR